MISEELDYNSLTDRSQRRRPAATGGTALESSKLHLNVGLERMGLFIGVW